MIPSVFMKRVDEIVLIAIGIMKMQRVQQRNKHRMP